MVSPRLKVGISTAREDQGEFVAVTGSEPRVIRTEGEELIRCKGKRLRQNKSPKT